MRPVNSRYSKQPIQPAPPWAWQSYLISCEARALETQRPCRVTSVASAASFASHRFCLKYTSSYCRRAFVSVYSWIRKIITQTTPATSTNSTCEGSFHLWSRSLPAHAADLSPLQFSLPCASSGVRLFCARSLRGLSVFVENSVPRSSWRASTFRQCRSGPAAWDVHLDRRQRHSERSVQLWWHVWVQSVSVRCECECIRLLAYSRQPGEPGVPHQVTWCSYCGHCPVNHARLREFISMLPILCCAVRNKAPLLTSLYRSVKGASEEPLARTFSSKCMKVANCQKAKHCCSLLCGSRIKNDIKQHLQLCTWSGSISHILLKNGISIVLAWLS